MIRRPESADTISSSNRSMTLLTSEAPNAAPVLDSRALLCGERELLIVHGDQLYRLRHTRNDKLILTK